ncbi:Acyl-coenzyme A thioesterase PaaI, contains HGG motif [Halobacillus dabanensis]|uniref:Acyl-coenzyme A thioesterase PaaI, contains HGG motif n=1 Tax=Halobacillus dabanensis TaxID=240302 RepID=A0A1I3RSL6_HALDA|nr:PaaI family thioesterase [Halobacillus dabanensis]SFJ48902.1 Acyl-coenzyme A thioesterase PaaI, contains HGG motif [Halobacillus dabanensis]
MRESSSFFEHLGFHKYIDRDGRVILSLEVKPENITEDSTIPSGLFSSMLDTVIGSTIGETLQVPTSTVNLNMNYVDFSNNGPFSAHASITHKDGKMIVGEGTVLDGEDKVVAKGVGTFKVSARDSDQKG